jgi:hypothetical protein
MQKKAKRSVMLNKVLQMKGLADILLSLEVKYQQNKFATIMLQGTKARIKKNLFKASQLSAYLPTFATR